MAKTVHTDGNQGTGTPGSVVLAAFLNALNNLKFGGQDIDGHTAAFKKGADIAAAAALVFDTSTGNRFTVTGATAITSMPNLGGGTHVVLEFAASPTITHDAANGNIKCPDAQNLIPVPGEKYLWAEYAAGKWELVANSANLTQFVTLTNNQTIANTKTFSSPPVVPSSGITVGSLTRLGTTVELSGIDDNSGHVLATSIAGASGSLITYEPFSGKSTIVKFNMIGFDGTNHRMNFLHAAGWVNNPAFPATLTMNGNYYNNYSYSISNVGVVTINRTAAPGAGGNKPYNVYLQFD